MVRQKNASFRTKLDDLRVFNYYPAKSRGISSDQTIFREIELDNCFIIQQIDNKTAEILVIGKV